MMRLIKGVFVVMISLFSIITLFSLLIPSSVRISRAVVINNANAAEVYRQIIPFENWKNWHPIFTADSAVFSREAIDKSVHIIHRQQDILLLLQKADSNSVQFLLQTKGANDIQNEIVIHTLASQQAVQVEWRTITRLNWYPWEKFYGIFLDQLTGASYEGALNGLKGFLEGGLSNKKAF
jgi:hypothetical protein